MRQLLSDLRKLFRLAASPKQLRQLRYDVRMIRQMLSDAEASQSHFPEEPRKSPARMFADNLFWLIRHGEVNQYYFCWGLDCLHAPPLSELLSYGQFRKLRDERNQAPPQAKGYNYLVLLRDKCLFAQHLEALGYPTPRIVAMADRDGVNWCRPRRRAPLTSLLEAEGGLDVFAKPLAGEQGQGVFPLRVMDKEIFVDDARVTLGEFAARLSGATILQERVVQHPTLSAVHPQSLNTIRLTTVREQGRARPFSFPYFRVGSGGSAVDNFKAGGIQVFIDIETGRLRGPGRRLRGGISTHHPDSGIAFDGFAIPYFAEAVDLAVRLHDDLPGLHSVGWDLAITPEGPIVIEGNDNWNGSIRMGLDPDFKREFIRLCTLP